MNRKINPRLIVLAVMIVTVGIFRIATAQTHSSLSGFTPLGAMALFGGFYFSDHWKAFLFPLLTLWLSDIFLNRYLYFGEWVFFYNGFAWVYAGFALIVLIGKLLKAISIKNILLASVAAAVVHSLVSNFGVWLVGCTSSKEDILYSPDLDGLLTCYYMGLPYLRNFLIGNLFYCGILFGAFELMQRRFVILKYQP